MRTVWLVSILAAVLTTPASAGQITLKDLVGITIRSTVVREQTTRDLGKKYEGTVRSEVEVIFGGSGDPIQFVQTSTWQNNKTGYKSTWTGSGSGLLGKPQENRRSGGGYGVGFLQNDALYYIRTFKSGGFKFEFKLARTSKGLACTSRETFLQERGSKEIRVTSDTTRRPIVVLSDRQVSSTCSVIKR